MDYGSWYVPVMIFSSEKILSSALSFALTQLLVPCVTNPLYFSLACVRIIPEIRKVIYL